MTKIKSYPIDSSISGSDKWIGSDSGSFNATKNFSVSGLSSYYNSVGAVNMANSLLFKYDTVDLGDSRSIGSFSFASEIGATVSFSSITDLIFHKNTYNGRHSVDIMTSYKDSIVLIQKTDSPNIFAYYKVQSYDQNLIETDFYDVSLLYINGNGFIEEDQFYFVSLIQFDSIQDTDKHYTHNQSVAASTWNVNHNLGKYPSVTVTLSNGQVGYGDVTYIDENNLTITFSGANSGKAYMN
jgi:hypothetical protein